MPILTASLTARGRSYPISPHFTLGEFASGDGADLVRYSTELLALLEQLRGDDLTVVINSGYRTAAHNKAVGGASRSQHVEGTAADVMVLFEGKPLDARYLCCRCQTLGFPGVAYISATAVHLDARTKGIYRGDERKNYRGNVNNDFYTYFGLTKAEVDGYFAQFTTTDEQEERPMTQQQFNEMMDSYLAQRAAAQPSDWSLDARRWAEQQGIIQGDGKGNYRYQSPCTREEVITFLYRAVEKE